LAWPGCGGTTAAGRCARLHFALVCGFVIAHSIGARWLYSYVPYDAWLQAATGWSPAQAFGWERNHFDRFIHLDLRPLCFAPADLGLAAPALARRLVGRGQGFARRR
jgi:uncharacterized membrane protein YjdF